MNFMKMEPKLFKRLWNRFDSIESLQAFTKLGRSNLYSKKRDCESLGESGFKDLCKPTPAINELTDEEFKREWNKAPSMVALEGTLCNTRSAMLRRKEKAEQNGMSGFKKFREKLPPPPTTKFLPGTWEKVEVLKWRAERGHPLFLDGDAKGDLT